MCKEKIGICQEWGREQGNGEADGFANSSLFGGYRSLWGGWIWGRPGFGFSGFPPSHAQVSLIFLKQSYICLCPKWSSTSIYYFHYVILMHYRYLNCLTKAIYVILIVKNTKHFMMNNPGMLLRWMIRLEKEARPRRRMEEKEKERLDLLSTTFVHILVFQCDICKQNLKRGERMSHHVRSHKVDKPLECIYPGCNAVRQHL